MKSLKTNNGAISIILLWSIIFFIAVLSSVFILEIYYMNLKAEIVKDAVTMSVLSVYGGINISQLQSGDINKNESIQNSFKKYLSRNLNLNNDLSSRPNSAVAGQVTIDDLIIYNKTNSDKMYPNGQIIYYKPSIYVKISYDVEPILKGILGNKKRVSTTATADLVNN